MYCFPHKHREQSPSEESAMTDIIDRLEELQCGCEREVFLRDAIPSRNGLIRALDQHGFGRPGSAIPTDWRTYFHDDELREHVLSYCKPAA